jgi:hypothetical protein
MKRAVIAALVIFLVAMTILFARPYIWIRDFRATVDCDGHRLAGSRVYWGKDDALFIIFGPPYHRGYVILLQEQAVGLPGYNFFVRTSIVEIARNPPGTYVNLRSPKVDSHDPKLQIKNRTAEFLDLDGHDVQIAW